MCPFCSSVFLFSARIHHMPLALLLTMVRWKAWVKTRSRTPIWQRAMLLSSRFKTSESIIFYLASSTHSACVFLGIYFPLDSQYLLLKLSLKTDDSLPHLRWGSFSLGSLLWPESSRDTSFWLHHVPFRLSGVSSLTFQTPFWISRQSPAPPAWSAVPCQLVASILWSIAMLCWPLFPELYLQALPVPSPPSKNTMSSQFLTANQSLLGFQNLDRSHLDGVFSGAFHRAPVKSGKSSGRKNLKPVLF